MPFKVVLGKFEPGRCVLMPGGPEEAIELEPNDINLRLDYAGACRASGDLPKAKSAAENVMSLEPSNTSALREMSRILSQMGESKAATSGIERHSLEETTEVEPVALRFVIGHKPRCCAKVEQAIVSVHGAMELADLGVRNLVG